MPSTPTPPSTSTTAAAASSNTTTIPSNTNTPDPAIANLLEKMAAYVEGEAEISIEDYRLLRDMNLAAAERYSEMAESSAGLVSFAQRLQTKCEAMMPALAQVWNICVDCGDSLFIALTRSSLSRLLCLRLTCSRRTSRSWRAWSSSWTAIRSG